MREVLMYLRSMKSSESWCTEEIQQSGLCPFKVQLLQKGKLDLCQQPLGHQCTPIPFRKIQYTHCLRLVNMIGEGNCPYGHTRCVFGTKTENILSVMASTRGQLGDPSQ